MLNNKKLPAGALVAAGLAAFAYYKYSKMSEEQKHTMVNDLKDKAQNLYDQYMPTEVKDIFSKDQQVLKAALVRATSIPDSANNSMFVSVKNNYRREILKSRILSLNSLFNWKRSLYFISPLLSKLS